MAARDVNLIKFVESALRFKIRNPSATHYNYFSFNPFIYKWAKKAFFDYGIKKNFQNLDNEGFTNELIKGFINQDPDLKNFLDPLKIAELPEESHLELQQDIQVEREKIQQNKTVYHPISQPIPQSVPQETEQISQEPIQTPTEEEKKQEGGGPQIPRQALEKLGDIEKPTIPETPRISIPETPRIPTPKIGGTIQNLGSNVSRGISKGTSGLLRAGGNLGGKLGGAIIQGGTRMLASGGAAAAAAVGWPVIIAVLVVIIAIPVLFLIFNLFNTSTQCPPYQPNCGAPQVISASTLPPPGSIDPNAPYVPGGGKGLISCPVNSGIITNGSQEAGGHCSLSYEAKYGVCARPGEGNYRGKETAIDVISFDKVVFVPFLTGGANPQLWTIDEVGTPIAEYEGGGIAAGMNTQASGHIFRIRFVHLSSTTLKIGDQVPPNTPIGQYKLSANHVHITLQEDGVFKPADLYFNLCQ